tara:strand:+ start:443 stop:898 length:456 start_codon:yes stop_codon:yes gene_type:complete
MFSFSCFYSHFPPRIDRFHIFQEECVVWSESTLGHGRIRDVRDIVFIDPEQFNKDDTKLIAEQVGKIADPLNVSKDPYILIGPGRWGTSQPSIGIPVTWSNISGVACIVETEIGNKSYAPSQGSHFFQNLTSFGVGHMTVNLFKDKGTWYL